MDCEEIIGFCVFEEFLFCFVSFSLSFFFFLVFLASFRALCFWNELHSILSTLHIDMWFFLYWYWCWLFSWEWILWGGLIYIKEVCEEIIGFLKRFYCYFVSFSSWKWVLWVGLICIVKKYLCFDEFFVLFHFL